MRNVANIPLDNSIASTLLPKPRSGQAALTIGAIGVVLGNIGTSPLYAVDQIFYGPAHLAPTPDNVLGCISLVIWALTLIVSLKYAVFILRADNDGEGGVFALYSLLHNYREEAAYLPLLLAGLMLGAGFLFGDGIISPAISVLAAVEGLEVATPMFRAAVIPITVVILALLFAVQYRGTSGVGPIFGPVLIIWFIVLALLGVWQIQSRPDILRAFNPAYAVAFLQETKSHTVLVTLGALMLVVTGGEAMYADLGHFGARPIRVGWFAIAFPALILNYLGQGALMLEHPPAHDGELFYSMAPREFLYPVVALATLATVIAAQGLISGSFSLASQAVALGLFPRLRIIHTHDGHKGQIYIPFVNWALFAGCTALVLGFRSTEGLAALYASMSLIRRFVLKNSTAVTGARPNLHPLCQLGAVRWLHGVGAWLPFNGSSGGALWPGRVGCHGRHIRRHDPGWHAVLGMESAGERRHFWHLHVGQRPVLHREFLEASGRRIHPLGHRPCGFRRDADLALGPKGNLRGL